MSGRAGRGSPVGGESAGGGTRAGGKLLPYRLRLGLELLAYNLALLVLLPLMAAWLGWRLVVKRKPMGEWRHRLGLIPAMPASASPRIWVHAVSAGEMAAARPVIAELRRAFPGAGIALSTHTDTGMALARKTCKEADVIFYLPFDWPGTMGLALRRVRPELVVVLEKELWPNLLGMGRLMGAKVLAVNGRVSDRMVKRAWWLPGFVRWLYRLADCLCVQSARDARRLQELGVVDERGVIVAGNTKADTLAHRDEEAEARLTRELGVVDSEAWLVAGSTHAGEEEKLIEAFKEIRKEMPEARLLIAPRHLERVADVSAVLAQKGVEVVRRTEGRHDRPEAAVILDTMGELRAAYGFATVGFVGGTLVPIGGHNVLEPAAAGRPVLFGPHTENCADLAELLVEAGVGFQVAEAEGLAREFVRIARDGLLRKGIAKRAGELMERQRGASARCVEVVAKLLGIEVIS